MDKYDLVLDIIAHPEKYSPEQLEKFMRDPETKSIYDTVSLISSSTNSKHFLTPEEVRSEWCRFESRVNDSEESFEYEDTDNRPVSRPRVLYFFRSRAAAVSVVALTSLAAVAIGFGVKYVLGDKSHTPLVSAMSTRENVSKSVDESTTSTGNVSVDSIAIYSRPVVFENESLEALLLRITSAYGAKLVIAPSKASLRVYFKWNPAEPLEDVVDRLNRFEQIDITVDGKIVKVD